METKNLQINQINEDNWTSATQLMHHRNPPSETNQTEAEMRRSRNVGTMARKAPIRVIATFAEMFGGFPLAYIVVAVATITFSIFNLGSLLASRTPIYSSWLEVAQPFTNTVATFVPGVSSATTFLEQHRDFLEENGRLYWIPALRNVLSINFALLLFFTFCFTAALCINLVRDPERALYNIDAVCRGLGRPIDKLILKLMLAVSVGLLPVYFGFAAQPYLISFTANIIYYFVVLGASGLFLFLAIYLVAGLLAIKLRPRAEHRVNAAPDKPNEN